jgi:hypothetical protein
MVVWHSIWHKVDKPPLRVCTRVTRVTHGSECQVEIENKTENNISIEW